jgi:DNA-binding FrmR family transcriptional regulator
MKTSEQRINNIIGQLEGVKRSLALSRKDCSEMLIQLKAVRSATSSLMNQILENEFSGCLKRGEKDRLQKIFKEVIN